MFNLRFINQISGLLLVSFFLYGFSCAVNAKSLFTLEHVSGYKIKGKEVENTTNWWYRDNLFLKTTGLVRWPRTHHNMNMINNSIVKLTYQYMMDTDYSVPGIIGGLGLLELSTQFRELGVEMHFPGWNGCDEFAVVSCLPYKDFSSGGTGKTRFIDSRIEPADFHVHELGNFVFIVTRIYISPGILIANGYIDPELAPEFRKYHGVINYQDNKDRHQPVTIAIGYKWHELKDFSDDDEFATVTTHFHDEFIITEKFVNLYLGHLSPSDITAYDGYRSRMHPAQVSKYHSLTGADFDESLLQKILKKLGLETEYFNKPEYNYGFLASWLFGIMSGI